MLKKLIWACICAMTCLEGARIGRYSGGPTTPNIIMFLADDLGWNDVGFQGGSEIETPYIDALANEGIRLTRSYVQVFCSPTRISFLTGRYPIRTGFQGGNLSPQVPYGLPLTETIISQEMKRAQYATFMLGKWGAGYFDIAHTPTHRGFDEFVGSYAGNINKLTASKSYVSKKDGNVYTGVDFRDGDDPNHDCEATDFYTTDYYTDRANTFISDHVQQNPTQAFFMYMAYEVSHSPPNCPPKYGRDRYTQSTGTTGRVRYMGMVSGMDESINSIVNNLKALGIWENSVIVWGADNGGMSHGGHSSNYPYRGEKSTLWEGGVHSPGFISGGWIHPSNHDTTFDGLIHVTDWYRTFCSLAGLAAPTRPLSEMSGVDLSKLLKRGPAEYTHKRDEILLNMENGDGKCDAYAPHPDNQRLCGGIIWGKWKLVSGYFVDARTEHLSGWEDEPYDYPDNANPTVTCPENAPTLNEYFYNNNAPYNNDVALFNLEEDPCEYHDVSLLNPTIVTDLVQKMRGYESQVTPTLGKFYEEEPLLSDPTNSYLNGYWGPWSDHRP